MSGATIGGLTFASLGLNLLSADIPLLPETRQVTEEIAGMDGEIDMDTSYGPRPINLDVIFNAEDETDYQIKLQHLSKIFDTKKGEQLLVLDRMPGKRWRVKYNGKLPVEKIATLGEFTLPFKAFFPFSASILDVSTPLELGQGYTLGMGLRLGDTYSFTVNGSSTITVYHAGTYEVYPVIQITGTGSAIMLTNNITNESMAYSGTLAAGQILEIDCRDLRKSAILDGVNVTGQMDGTFIKLAEGENSITISGTALNLSVSFYFRHTYLY